MGELSDLPGEGAPLSRDQDAEAGVAWAARHLMRGANAVPEWAELRKDIAAWRERIARRLRAHREWIEARAQLLRKLPADRIVESARLTRERDERVRAEIEDALVELNGLVARHNLLVPLPLQLPSVSLDRL